MAEQSTQPPRFDTVIVTGFGPFLEHRQNPSWAVARACAAELDRVFSVRTAELSVTHRKAEQFAADIDWESGRVLALHFGLSARRDFVALERCAYNERGKTPDETGREDFAPELDPGGPPRRQTQLEVDRLAAGFADVSAGPEPAVDVRPSDDVGDYVCNTLYYHSLGGVERARRASKAAEALFVHVPSFTPAQAASFGEQFGRLLCAHFDIEL